MRNTKQRDLILKIVNDSYSHLTADEVYVLVRKELPNISLGTVYRNLNVLVNLKKIRKIKTFDNKDHYDKAFKKHDHFICLKCNRVFDLYDTNYIESKILPKSFEVINCDITYSGYCNECKKGR